jgi:hypothetical protein
MRLPTQDGGTPLANARCASHSFSGSFNCRTLGVNTGHTFVMIDWASGANGVFFDRSKFVKTVSVQDSYSDPRQSCWANKSAIQIASLTSVLRPGMLRMCRNRRPPAFSSAGL